MPSHHTAIQPSPAHVPVDAAVLEYSRALVSALPETTVIVVRADETVWVAEGRLLARGGQPPGVRAGDRLADILPEANQDVLRAHFQTALGGAARHFEYRAGDERVLLWVELTPLYLGAAEPVAVTAVIQDLTERHRLSAELNEERERRRMAEKMGRFGCWEADVQAGTVTLSDELHALIGDRDGRPRAAVRTVLRHVARADRRRLLASMQAAAQTGEGEAEVELRVPGEPRRWVLVRGRRRVRPDGRARLTGVAVDRTELRQTQRVHAESEAFYRAAFDASPIGMSFIETSTRHYVRVNDALCRLLGRSREELIGRSPTDVSHPDDQLLDRTVRAEQLKTLTGELTLERRFLTPDGRVVHTAVHATPLFDPAGALQGLLSQVVDLTAIKEREARLVQEAADLKQVVAIRSALAEDRFVLHAQPIIDLRTGETVQRELLVRMREPEGELVLPGAFLPAAERRGCMWDIDQWVIGRGIEHAAAGLAVELNLSALSVGDDTILETIRDALRRTGAPPERVVFEITETALMADLDRGRRFAEALRALGCQLALDDFGTGYGTLTYLKHIPADHVKIDVEFVRDLATSAGDESVVKGIVAIARELGKTTIAEGVSDAGTLRRLRELGVDYAQGYFIGRPAPLPPVD